MIANYCSNMYEEIDP